MTPVFRTPAAARLMALYRQGLDRWPVPSAHTHVPTRQGETFLVSFGPEGAPPLILLHGAQSNAASWMFDAAVWAAAFRVHAIDMIGEGGQTARVLAFLTGGGECPAAAASGTA